MAGGPVRVAQSSEVQQGVYVPAGDARREWEYFFCFITFVRKKTEGKAMLKSSEEVGKAFIVSKTQNQKLSDENWSISPIFILNVCNLQNHIQEGGSSLILSSPVHYQRLNLYRLELETWPETAGEPK